ncbi:MAG: class I SAM-dependent methyltransferase [Actinomycetota bacterium]|nr:class I SAM-dependent methyltransferase [Actinomycetota bacterium]
MDEHLGRVYDSMAPHFEAHAADGPYNAHYDRPALLDLLGPVDGLRVLDAGCGPGFYSENLLERGAHVVAIDASLPMVELARTRLGSDTTVLQHMLGTPLPFDDGTFDAVVCALTIHHVEDRHAALAELHRVLRPGGAMVLSTQHPTTDWLRKGGSYFDVVVETDVWRLPTSEWSVGYWREPLTSLSDAIFRAGFLIERIVEPLPTESMLERWPDEHAVLMQRPGFLHLRLLTRDVGGSP